MIHDLIVKLAFVLPLLAVVIGCVCLFTVVASPTSFISVENATEAVCVLITILASVIGLDIWTRSRK